MDKKRNDEYFMERAIELSALAVEHNEPFGAVLVKDGQIVFENENQIYTAHDPSFHGEMGLIRRFCKETGITDLSGYTLYSSCEPCFMCSGAMVGRSWADWCMRRAIPNWKPYWEMMTLAANAVKWSLTTPFISRR